MNAAQLRAFGERVKRREVAASIFSAAFVPTVVFTALLVERNYYTYVTPFSGIAVGVYHLSFMAVTFAGSIWLAKGITSSMEEIVGLYRQWLRSEIETYERLRMDAAFAKLVLHRAHDIGERCTAACA
jgi:hypothetical protein